MFLETDSIVFLGVLVSTLLFLLGVMCWWEISKERLL